ncbi:GNAT family N-acetyltransferase [Lentibacillus daqui]|uniref:GNAT family N-acetyltransferase n=1 Tax=Lentibacillus daqui TaxID=2911514 RepID=UPI0022B19E56|nr:GNAT family N-acetyltransferase [Lentibacillus daqui]
MEKENRFDLDQKIVVRNTKYKDIDGIIALSQAVFEPSIAFQKEQIESQLEIFPEGQYCVEYNGKIVGSCSSLIVNYTDYGNNHSFEEISDHNFIRNHNPEGQNLYGIDVSVHPDYRQLKIGRRLYSIRRNICRDFNLKSIMFGGRIPSYNKYADKMGVHEYVEKVSKGIIYDPVLTFQLRNGFNIKQIMENYIPEDKESLGYGVLMEWINEQYNPAN